MANNKGQKRKRANEDEYALQTPPFSPRKKGQFMDSPFRTALIRDAIATKGKIKRETLFKKYNVSRTQGYQILQSNSLRRPESMHNRGRKELFPDHYCHAVEVVENSSFDFGTRTHYNIAQLLGLVNGVSERTVQRRMKEYGVGTFTAAQVQPLSIVNIQKRFDRCSEWKDHPPSFFRQFCSIDEVHAGPGPMKRIRVHRRRGAIFRRQRNKCQYRYHRVTQKLHMIAFITYNTKSRLYFYSNKNGGGSLNRTTFIHLVKDHLITDPAWRWDKCLFLDNDQAHGTRGRKDNKVKQFLRNAGVRFCANTPKTPELQAIERIWRIVKQRLKIRQLRYGKASVLQLKTMWQEEWKKISQTRIRKEFDKIPGRCQQIYEAGGDFIIS
jgi:transposase